MIQAIAQPLSFEAFLDWHPNDGRKFELYQGVPVEMNPTGTHEQVSGFTQGVLFTEIRERKLPYFIPSTATIKPYRDKSGYKPDVVVLSQAEIANEPLWQKRSTITNGKSAILVVEVASTNWRDDYGVKLSDYEEIGIGEYWIVDYLALGAARLIGSPKLPTITVYQLVEGEYQFQQFRGSDRIISLAFPNLQLTAEQVFAAGQ